MYKNNEKVKAETSFEHGIHRVSNLAYATLGMLNCNNVVHNSVTKPFGVALYITFFLFLCVDQSLANLGHPIYNFTEVRILGYSDNGSSDKRVPTV